MMGGSSGRLDVYSGSLGSCRIRPGWLSSVWKQLDQLIVQSFHKLLGLTGSGKMIVS